MNQCNLENGFNTRKTGIVICFVLIIVYGLFNARNIILGPSIEIFNPATTELQTESNTLTIKGKVLNMTKLTISGRTVLVDTQDFFEEKILLSPGFNNIEILASDRFGQQAKKVLKVYYKQTAESAIDVYSIETEQQSLES